MRSGCGVIIVTHNSEKYIGKAITSLQTQTILPRKVVIVDSGSRDPSYLDIYDSFSNIQVVKCDEDAGFCKGNNLGADHLGEDAKFILFLNPDAMLANDFMEKAELYMSEPRNCRVGAITGTTYGYDIAKHSPTGRYDTTGIFRRWYGKWYDRAQGEVVDPCKYQKEEEIDAICGAVFFCRKKALDEIRLSGGKIFDDSFFMYKEDIDLSLRLRNKEWQIRFVPHLICYHCRGWNIDRSEMARKYRLLSVQNELKVNRTPIPKIYSLIKYALVKFFDY